MSSICKISYKLCNNCRAIINLIKNGFLLIIVSYNVYTLEIPVVNRPAASGGGEGLLPIMAFMGRL